MQKLGPEGSKACAGRHDQQDSRLDVTEHGQVSAGLLSGQARCELGLDEKAHGLPLIRSHDVRATCVRASHLTDERQAVGDIRASCAGQRTQGAVR
jgi:hypothetical protein